MLASVANAKALLVSPCCYVNIDWQGPRCSCCGRSFSVTSHNQPVLLLPEHSVIGSVSSGESPIARENVNASRPGDNAAASAAVNYLRDELASSAIGLIIGGGSLGNGLAELYTSAITLLSFDIYASDLTQFVADAHHIPLPDNSVDAVVIQAVLEHVLDPTRVVGEIHRILKPGGLVYAETPFMQQVHEGAYDFTRFSERGHRWLFRHFEQVDSGAVAGPLIAFSWSLDYALRALFRSRRLGLLARRLSLPLRFLDRKMPPELSLPGASCVYFLGRRATTAISAQELIAGFRGSGV